MLLTKNAQFDLFCTGSAQTKLSFIPSRLMNNIQIRFQKYTCLIQPEDVDIIDHDFPLSS